MIRTMTIEDYEQVHDLLDENTWFRNSKCGLIQRRCGALLKENPTTSVVAVEDDKIVGAILCGQ